MNDPNTAASPPPPPLPPPVGDEQLSAWLDGELGAAEAAAVEAWLREHPEARARIEAWDADRRALRAAFTAVPDEPVPPALQRLVWRGGDEAPAAASVRQRPWALAAAAAGLLVTGALAGAGATWPWHRAQEGRLAAGTPQGWVQRAAYAHSVFVMEPRHYVEVKAQEEHLARWLTRRIEFPVKLFDLNEFGFQLVGGRLLPDGPGKSAQLMYQDAAGRRVTVYLRKPEKGVDAAFRYERQGDLGMFYWVEEGCGYALVGPLPRQQLLAMAESIHEQEPVLPAPNMNPPAPAAAAASK
jgi:anti-sigma factor RsiW